MIAEYGATIGSILSDLAASFSQMVKSTDALHMFAVVAILTVVCVLFKR
jgi:hypothetical protein